MANGGLDLEMPKGRYFNEAALMPLLDAGKVKVAAIDDKISRQLRMAFSMGWFDRPQAVPSIPKNDPQNASVALQGAREGIVLLKNQGNLLPLSSAKVKKIVVLGHNADPAVTGAAGSAFTLPFHSVSTLAGLEAQAGNAVGIVRVPWVEGQADVPPEYTGDVKEAGAVIVCVGFNDQQDHGADPKRQASEGEGADRSYALPSGQASLIRSVAALNPGTIVILNAGGSVETKDWIDKVPVLLDAFYPGQEGGTAIGEILFGQTNPSGKLPFSWEKQWEDSAAYGNYPTAADPRSNTYKEGVFLGYRWFDVKGTEPLFPFGFGLDYTSFTFSSPLVTTDANRIIEVTATIRNTGSRAGAEVIQVYVEPPKADVPRPVRELKAFSKVLLQPGESKTVTMPIAPADLAYWDPGTKAWVITPGLYTARIGDSSRNLPLTAQFAIPQ
jgi:beta-glucosidase